MQLSGVWGVTTQYFSAGLICKRGLGLVITPVFGLLVLGWVRVTRRSCTVTPSCSDTTTAGCTWHVFQAAQVATSWPSTWDSRSLQRERLAGGQVIETFWLTSPAFVPKVISIPTSFEWCYIDFVLNVVWYGEKMSNSWITFSCLGRWEGI